MKFFKNKNKFGGYKPLKDILKDDINLDMRREIIIYNHEQYAERDVDIYIEEEVSSE